MSIPLTINGVTFQYPQEFDTHWGPTLTNWSSAVTTGMLQTSGVNAATLIKSATANPALSGFLELAKTDTVSWRNNANSADLALGINGSNQLTFNGTPIGAATTLTHNHIFVGTAGNTLGDVAMSGDATIINTGALTIANGAVTNAKIVASAGITLTKLAALTASELVVSDGSGFLTSLASPSLTEIGYVAGVTSAIQTQLNSISSSLGNYLPLAGGTMSGNINMGSNKITALSGGTSSGEAIPYNTANSVTTLALVANAVTQYVQTGSSPVAGAGSATSVDSISITTTGGPVLVFATANISVTPNGFSPHNYGGGVFGVWNATAGSTYLSGGKQILQTLGDGTNLLYLEFVCICVDTPAAGTWNYQSERNINLGTFSAVASHSLMAVELKR